MCLFKQRHDMSCVLHRSSGILKLAETLTRYVQTGLRAGSARRMPSTWLVMTHGWVPAGSVVRHVKFALTMIAAAKHRIECELVTCLYWICNAWQACLHVAGGNPVHESK